LELFESLHSQRVAVDEAEEVLRNG